MHDCLLSVPRKTRLTSDSVTVSPVARLREPGSKLKSPTLIFFVYRFLLDRILVSTVHGTAQWRSEAKCRLGRNKKCRTCPPFLVWLFEFEFDLEFLTDRFACFNPFIVLDIVTTVKYIGLLTN